MPQTKMTNKTGFTMIEVLFVLGIVSVLLLLSTPISIASLEREQEKQFLKTFEFDVLYIQQLSTSTTEQIKIRLYDDKYKIFKNYDQTIAVRDYPTGWKVDARSDREINFNQNGTFRNPRKIEMSSKYAVYDIIFPFGKGRCYIVKK